jgi:hypothetical protein
MVAMLFMGRTFRTRKLLEILLAVLSLGSGLGAFAQDIMLPSDDFHPRLKKRKIPDLLPRVPTLTPAFSIPVAPLGYGTPGPTYLGRQNTLISLDFLDENRLLFSFRATGLIHRETSENSANEPRQMRAVVVMLADGKVESQALWMVPDLQRYVWMLRDGHFLLHDHDGLKMGDGKLDTKPFLQLPGELLSLEIDPSQKVLVTKSVEPAAATTTAGEAKGQSSGSTTGGPFQVAVRVVDVASGQVIETQRVRAAPQLPIDAEGYLDITHDKLDQWSLKLNAFHGGTRVLGHVESTCLPTTNLFSDREILVSGCNPAHERKLRAVSATGQQMWEIDIPIPIIQPLYAMSPDGSRFSRESIVLNNGVKPDSQMLWVKAVKGQVARVFDAANGKPVLEAPVSPTLDGGGNVAFSPSGRRFAVLNQGAIEVFELPLPAR